MKKDKNSYDMFENTKWRNQQPLTHKKDILAISRTSTRINSDVLNTQPLFNKTNNNKIIH
jgi:hypothetical protein